MLQWLMSTLNKAAAKSVNSNTQVGASLLMPIHTNSEPAVAVTQQATRYPVVAMSDDVMYSNNASSFDPNRLVDMHTTGTESAADQHHGRACTPLPIGLHAPIPIV